MLRDLIRVRGDNEIVIEKVRENDKIRGEKKKKKRERGEKEKGRGRGARSTEQYR